MPVHTKTIENGIWAFSKVSVFIHTHMNYKDGISYHFDSEDENIMLQIGLEKKNKAITLHGFWKHKQKYHVT